MPNHASSYRFYRATGHPDNLVKTQVVIDQTDLMVLARQDLSSEISDLVHRLRAEIRAFATLHPEFLTSLLPIPAPEHSTALIKDMLRAARAVGVGPMAAVAGTIAQHVADSLAPRSPDILVENGGDVYMRSTVDRVVGILPAEDGTMLVGTPIAASDFPCALCGSSATIGHSLSFGHADLVVVRSPSGAIADAAATHLANLLREKSDLPRVLARAEELAECGVEGVLAQCDGQIGAWGKMELTAL
jgi:ApbE superfamily uncharacterized protein (UPF0280 family)